MKRIILILMLLVILCGCMRKEEYHKAPTPDRPSLHLIRETAPSTEILWDAPSGTLIALDPQPKPLCLLPEEPSERPLLSHLAARPVEI